MNYNKTAFLILKFIPTIFMTFLGLCFVFAVYVYYTYSPQTRDGKIKVEVVGLAADVSGRVDEVMVKDNQYVKLGDTLFVVDRVRLANDLRVAEANVANAKVQGAAAERERTRYSLLAEAVSKQDLDRRDTDWRQSRALLSKAEAELQRAQINFERATVRSPVNGIVTNFSLRPGTYAIAGQPVMALVDTDSYYVAGYFEETKLSNIGIGDEVEIYLMGEKETLKGHIQSFAAAIEDRERTSSAGSMLANVNPTFNWVRLAQRIPVRISLDRVPNNVALVAGRTVSVVVRGEQGFFALLRRAVAAEG